MKNTARIGGIALIVFALAFVATFALEARRVSLGFEDGDNPEQSVAFIKLHGGIYEASGTLQVFMTIALTFGTLAVAIIFCSLFIVTLRSSLDFTRSVRLSLV